MQKKIKASLSFFSTIWMLFAGIVGHSKSHLFLLPPPPSSLRQLELDQILKISFSSLG